MQMSIVTLVSYLIFGSVLGATFSNSSALKAAAWRKHCFCHAGGLGQFLNFLKIDLVVSVTTLGQGIVVPDGTPSSVGMLAVGR